MKEKFEAWLIREEKKSSLTAKNYAKMITKVSEHYTQNEKIYTDLYKIEDIDQLEEIAELYKGKGKYRETGDTAHGGYRAAVNALVRFRKNTPSKNTRKPKASNTTTNDIESFSFNPKYKQEAYDMSKYYEIFYSLERTIRSIVAELMENNYGKHWWDRRVSAEIRESVENNLAREMNTGYTPRSDNKLDYTTFGELRLIVKNNWNAFSGTFSSYKAFNDIMIRLNILRVPIMHCTPLVEDEILRLNLTVKDWFRLLIK